MNRILFATDLTERSHNAARRALRIASDAGCLLDVLHVVPKSASDEDVHAIRERIRAEICGAAAGPDCYGPEVRIHVQSGSPSDTILELARHKQPDLVVLGGHGNPRFRDSFLGTTALHVLRQIGRTVLVAQIPSDQDYRLVMAAVDESPEADEILREALAKAVEEMVAVHAFQLPVVEGMTGEVIEILTSDPALILRDRVEKVRSQLKKSTPVHQMVVEGDVISVLSEAWTRLHPDLVVMGIYHSRLTRFLKGSFAKDCLLRCSTDMLFVPTSE